MAWHMSYIHMYIYAAPWNDLLGVFCPWIRGSVKLKFKTTCMQTNTFTQDAMDNLVT